VPHPFAHSAKGWETTKASVTLRETSHYLRVPHPLQSKGWESTNLRTSTVKSNKTMPSGLTRDLHFITFSCYHRRPFLNTAASRDAFVKTLEETRRKYESRVAGYVVMPEHVHLLASEPKVGTLSTVLQVVKHRTTRKVNDVIKGQMWQRRFYDFNVFTQEKQTEKLLYMHENPVKRGLVLSAEDWRWSSASFYSFGEQGVIKILNEMIPTYSDPSRG
jgi:REP-associated tyrosine transposase